MKWGLVLSLSKGGTPCPLQPASSFDRLRTKSDPFRFYSAATSLPAFA